MIRMPFLAMHSTKLWTKLLASDHLVEALIVHEPFRDLLPVGGLAPEPEGLGEEAQVIVADDASDGFLCH